MTLNVSKNLIDANVMFSSRLGLAWFNKDCCMAKGKVAIVGGAPSIKNYINSLKSFDGVIISTNGSHDYLVEQGVYPDIYFQLDARKVNKFAQKRVDGCVYMLASQCHPDSFCAIEPHMLVHVEHEHFPKKKVERIAENRGIYDFVYVSAKGTVGMTAIALAHTMGFDAFYLYGLDSSFDDYHHAYEQPQNDYDKIIDYRGFKTTLALMGQIGHFEALLPLMRDCTIVIKSDGLIKEVYNELKTRS